MSTDPAMNYVVFELKQNGALQRVVKERPTRANDFIRSIWHEIQREQDVQDRMVQQIYSEWEMSQDDKLFVASHFPQAKVTYSFSRPKDDQWDQAFAEARLQMAKAMKRQTATGVASQARTILPVLRNADGLSQLIIHLPLIPELALHLAYVGRTENGSQRIDYVFIKEYQERQDEAVSLMEQSFAHLTQGLAVHAMREKGRQFFLLQRQDGFAASAVGLPDFAKNSTQWLGSGRFFVGIPDPDTLLLSTDGSLLTNLTQARIRQTNDQGPINLTPCLLLFENGTFTMQSRW